MHLHSAVTGQSGDWRGVLCVSLLASLLAGCENDASSYQVDGKDQAIVLIREQRYFWDNEVDQALVVNRLPECQRRHNIRKGAAGVLKMEVYRMNAELYALRQGKQWYVANLRDCEVNKAEAPSSSPGDLMGAFVIREDRVRFLPPDKLGRRE